MKAAFVLFEHSDIRIRADCGAGWLSVLAGQGFETEIWIAARTYPDIEFYAASQVVHIVWQDAGSLWAPSLIKGLMELNRLRKPDILLFIADDFSADLCPGLALAIGADCLTSCTMLRFEKDLIYLEKPVYGGNLSGEFVITGIPFIVTLQEQRTDPSVRRTEKKCDVIVYEPDAAMTDDVRIVDIKPGPDSGLADAALIFAVGRAFDSRDEIAMVTDIAAMSGGITGVTRPLVQAGYMSSENMIGMSGMAVAPRLMVALGLSGSGPFLAGVHSAERIIAVNQDSCAPIFKMSDLGVVADCKAVLSEVLNLLTQDD